MQRGKNIIQKKIKIEMNRFYLTGAMEYQEFHAKEFPESRLK
jgi:hypothetical protein